jgi:uncharacterized protein YjeT (DUF2065 family)
MSATSIVMICFGIVAIIGRGPLIVAPIKTRDLYMSWIASARMLRLYGALLCLLTIWIIWATQHDVGTAAQIVQGFAWFIGVLSVVVLIPFPGPVSRLGTMIWQKFSDIILRLMGVFSVGVGLALIYYGVLWG